MTFANPQSGDKSGIQKRYFHHNERTIRDHPILLGQELPSLDARQDMLALAVPELAAAAAEDAIAEWGRPASDITHLVVSTYSGAHMPGADLRLASLLGLRPTVHRTVLYLQVRRFFSSHYSKALYFLPLKSQRVKTMKYLNL